MQKSADRRVDVRVGDLAVGSHGETLAAIGLGSCVAVVLDDRSARLGGLAHVMLPDRNSGRRDTPPARFADQAVVLLVEELVRAGAQVENLSARLVGGASMFEVLQSPEIGNIGARNVEACRAALQDLSVPVVAEAVGGAHGRSVFFDVASGAVRVTTVRHGEITL